MRKPIALAIALALALSLAEAGALLAHEEGGGEAKIQVEPSAITAGNKVVVAGSGLEPDSDRVLVLAGQDLTVEFGTVKTDAEGMFSKELTIPSHLPSGNYELRAIGDETLTAPLAVTATAAAAASPAIDSTDETVGSRQRSPVELAVILALVALAALAGGLLVWRAERLGGTARV